ncbi:hypothetical protein NM688_g8426 [Phlebia brevispora]|uniref:Uncharacterized protein n=1 Tax=Phlebia brevispora TaxID=194682 RepID=A0ACC1RTX1_9APHY|nr:hypothetical protein NM688_g8426 [Phlebia brevispora]
MVFGGLGVVLYGGQSPLAHMHRVFRKVDLQSMFFALIFVIIILVLAYLTNPTENSFRTYLTEQSFRQHLSRLEDSNHDDHSDSEDSGVHFNLTRRVASHKPVPSPPFLFANRAAVSLRTPKHVFYSFGIMTIAAVLPSGASNRSSSKGLRARQPGCGFLVSESWFIGAFGKWWRGGPIQSWWIDSMANAKDAERCNSGVLDMKALDNVNLECFEGLPPASSTHLSLTARESPSKSRSTERSLQRTTNNAPRSTTPPPLPKSASLPLHAPRISCSKSDKANGQRQTQLPPHPPATSVLDPVKLPQAPQLHSSASAIFDNSPSTTGRLSQAGG